MNMHIHIHTDSLCCAEEANNIIKQPYSNKNSTKKDSTCSLGLMSQLENGCQSGRFYIRQLPMGFFSFVCLL